VGAPSQPASGDRPRAARIAVRLSPAEAAMRRRWSDPWIQVPLALAVLLAVVLGTVAAVRWHDAFSGAAQAWFVAAMVLVPYGAALTLAIRFQLRAPKREVTSSDPEPVAPEPDVHAPTMRALLPFEELAARLQVPIVGDVYGGRFMPHAFVLRCGPASREVRVTPDLASGALAGVVAEASRDHDGVPFALELRPASRWRGTVLDHSIELDDATFADAVTVDSREDDDTVREILQHPRARAAAVALASARPKSIELCAEGPLVGRACWSWSELKALGDEGFVGALGSLAELLDVAGTPSRSRARRASLVGPMAVALGSWIAWLGASLVITVPVIVDATRAWWVSAIVGAAAWVLAGSVAAFALRGRTGSTRALAWLLVLSLPMSVVGAERWAAWVNAIGDPSPAQVQRVDVLECVYDHERDVLMLTVASWHAPGQRLTLQVPSDLGGRDHWATYVARPARVEIVTRRGRWWEWIEDVVVPAR
jgi:hypothetical protein